MVLQLTPEMMLVPQARGYLAAMPQVLPRLLACLPGHSKVVGSRDCDGVVMLVIEGPYINDGSRYVAVVSEIGPALTCELREIP